MQLNEKEKELDKILKDRDLYKKIKMKENDTEERIGKLVEGFFDWIASIDPVSNTTYEIAAWNYSPLSIFAPLE